MTTPKFFHHQERAINDTWDKKNFALLWEQGTGKTLVGVRTAIMQHKMGMSDMAIVVAPKGVHSNWAKEFALWAAGYPVNVHVYKDAKKLKAYIPCLNYAFNDTPPLHVISINYDALANVAVMATLLDLCAKYKVLGIVDESHYIKTPGAIRTHKVTALLQKCTMRRIMTGTPITKSPADLWAQFRALDIRILGIPSFYAFKAEFCQLVNPNADTKGMPRHEVMQVMLARKLAQRHRGVQIVMKDAQGREKYKNLDKLVALMAGHSSRVTKDECLDLPEKLYQIHPFMLHEEERELYRRVKAEVVTEENNERLTLTHALTRLLRLQQITSGMVRWDEHTAPTWINPERPGGTRAAALMDLLDNIEGKVIIWARFTDEIKHLAMVLAARCDGEVVTYYGDTDTENRALAVYKFQNESGTRYFVGNPAAGGTGITLTAARYMVYYSNSFNLADRLQSEDRFHRIGQTGNVTIIDMVATGTVDEKIASVLQSKRAVAEAVVDQGLGSFVNDNE